MDMWVPLENSPDVFQNYAFELFGANLNVKDVYAPECIESTDSVILIFDVKYQQQFYSNFSQSSIPSQHLTQTIGNSCGTIALLHILLNNQFQPTVNNNEYEQVKNQGNIDNIDIIRQLHDKYTDIIPNGLDMNGQETNEQQKEDEMSENTFKDMMDTNLHYIVLQKVGNKMLLFDGRIDEVLESEIQGSFGDQVIQLVTENILDQYEMMAIELIK
ncbi:Ubiquitin_carboxyl-terminal hydrolase family protein [Hexamita inflata]|uniref:ubiquitinyl hydrolase 1 n=1 Tax=Hexamita inflata TaxID=28002 RepID=A0AA86R8H1_9EUKA|nr:Ubiquitin carboxyl-terminal hydrolase family protein [Hexamita inflata]